MIEHLVDLDERTPVLVQGITGRMGRTHTRLMRAYGTNVVAGTAARADGSGDVPVFDSCRAAVEATGATVSIAMVGPHDVLSAASEAMDAGIRAVVTIAEGLPVHDALRLRARAAERGATWLGASTPGLAKPGQAKVGFLPEIALRPGAFAIVSKSGTLSYEIGYRLAASGLGQSVWIGVGGDLVKGLRFADLLHPLLRHAPTRAIILVGEVGGTEEEEFAETLADSGGSKPVFALIAGREVKEGVSMGHAGALVYGRSGTLDSKVACLREAGAKVSASIADLIERCSAFAASVNPPDAAVRR